MTPKSYRAPWLRWGRPALPVVVVSALLCLGMANIATLTSWQQVEDGVLWTLGPNGVTAEEIAPGTPAASVDLRPGDILMSIDDLPVQDLVDVTDALSLVPTNGSARYTVLRLGSREVVDVRVALITNGSTMLYYLLAAVGVFTLLVGGAVRLRRPFDQATLHFFWLSVVFFGMFTFSFSGRLDQLDWVFYWGDQVSTLLLPPLFLHFALVFPERRRAWTSTLVGRVVVPMIYLPALTLGLVRVAVLTWDTADLELIVRVVTILDRIDLLYLAVCFVAGAAALARALTDVRSITARRQLRWIAWGTTLGGAPFALGYAVPYAIGVDPSLPMQLSAIPLSLIPLAFASAIVRYRLMDIEVIVKRAFVYAAALAAIIALSALVLWALEELLVRGGSGDSWWIPILAVLVALLLAPPVKTWIQHALDRAFYRDRYNYRRALEGFAHDLNSDLDLNRLADRLVSRVVETLLVDRMALMLGDDETSHFASVRASGFGDGHPPALPRRSGIGGRLGAGRSVALDDPMAVSRFAVEEIEFWRDAGLYYFIPCVTNEGTIAVLALGRRSTDEPLNSEDMGLLETVTGQMATALENARLYRQLHLKALDLERARAFGENILESLSSGLLVVDVDDRIVRWNSTLEELCGVTQAQAVGLTLDDVFDAGFVKAIRAARRDAPTGASLSRLPLTSRDSKGRPTLMVNAAVVPLRASGVEDVDAGGTIVILEDITARVRLEEKLQISEKMASIGLLAAGVAHEVNTPLTGISSYTQMLREGADPDDPRTKLLEKIESQTFRAAKIVNGLLNLSRPAAASPDRVLLDVNVVITDVLALLEHQFTNHRIKVRRELTAELVVVLGIEHKLQQVLLNLCLNAKDAMPKGGWLSILTRSEQDRVVIEVSDTGSGIPNEYLARIYDPFFTTKTMGEGTGLGLSITYGIVQEHDGTIDCQSSAEQGTRFIIGLAAASSAAQGSLAARR
jgi:two-component system NtrC family sensor kinase